MKVLSLFDGISCGMVALKSIGIPVDRYVAFEIDKYSIKITTKKHPEIEHQGDIMLADFKEFYGFDMIIAGSPCTFWSIAKTNREVDTKGKGWGYFTKVIEAINCVKPLYFLYENVASMPKNIREKITESLGVEPILINSSLVSAQNRKRFYWTNIPNIAQPKDRRIIVKDILESGPTGKDTTYCMMARIIKPIHPIC